MDILIIVFIVVSAVSSLMRNLKKKQQAEQNKGQAPAGKQNKPASSGFPPRDFTLSQIRKQAAGGLPPEKTAARPPAALGSVPAPKLERSFVPMASSADRIELQPRFEEHFTEMESAAAAMPGYDDTSLRFADGDYPGGIPLSFNRDGLLRGIVMSEILARPQERKRGAGVLQRAWRRT